MKFIINSEVDNLFEKEIEQNFQFDEHVASVFDDMIDRSVPFYKENINLITKIISKFVKDGDSIIDLGSSTASLLLNIENKIDKDLKLLGIDNSKSMLEHAQKKIEAFNSNIELIHGDILEIDLKPSQVVILNYTLQFIRPIDREKLLSKVFNNLVNGGILILSEKIISKHNILNQKLIDIYYDYKREKGYSDYEIAQKREALENVLVPYREDENIRLLQEVGFSHIETIFKWANFVTFLAIK